MTSPGRPFDPRQPFSRADARAAGISVRTLLGGQFHKILYDSYIAAAVPLTLSVRAQAALRVSPPDAHISHHTAAELWGAVPPPTSVVHVSQPSAQQRTVRQGIQAHYCTTALAATTVCRGLRISTAEQAFCELAAVGTDLVDLVIVGDGLVKAGVTNPQKLVEASHQLTGRGAKLARRAARLVRDGVDSPMETRLRLLLVLAGLPEPEVNVILRGRDGEWLRRFDLCYREYRLVIEYDGRQHAENDKQWLSDISRREELDRDRWRLVVVTSHGIFLDPLRTLHRVRDALIDCGAVGVPRRFRNEWLRHFGVG